MERTTTLHQEELARSSAATFIALVLVLGALAGQTNAQLSATTAISDAQRNGLSSSFEVGLDFHFMYGDIDGFVQTPRGGQPGTTSSNRPTVDELGVDHVSIFDGSLSFQLDHHILTVGGQFIRADGDATLGRDLTSQGVIFPDGSRISADVQLDWYRVGYQYEWRFDLDQDGNELRFAPGIEGVLLDFDYELNAAGGLRARRSYAKGGVRLGTTLQWLTNGPFALEASAFWGLPIDGTAEILTLELIGKYQLWGDADAAGGSVFLGVAYEEVEYEDNQPVPNHIDVQLGPLLVAGMKVTF